MNSTKSWLSGRTFAGRFEIGRLIAVGGMSEVYQGIDLWTQNAVAVKVMAPRYASDPSKQQKFYRESTSLSHIQHRNIVDVIASSSEKMGDQELMYIVLEYVHGCTLEQLLRVRRVLSIREMLDIILPILEGLSEVHALRYIHRDLKPSNILISADEHSIKLTDFGLTRREDQTWTGELMGTPQFVAPEIVVSGSKVYQPTDIFAIGMMMFRMLTGRFPFTGDDQQILFSNVNKDVPSLSHFAPGINGGISGIVSWCTRRLATARPENASELLHELRRVVASLSVQELDYRAPIDGAPLPDYSWWSDVELIASKADPHWQNNRIITASKNVPDFTQAQEIISGAHFFDPEKYEEFEPLTGTDLTASFSAPASITAEYKKPQVPVSEPIREPQAPAAIDPRRPRYTLAPQMEPAAMTLGGIGLIFALVMAGWLGWWLAQSLMSSSIFQTLHGLF